MAIAKALIAKEAERQTGVLDLSRLWTLDALPNELTSLTALQELNCSFTQVRDLTPLTSLTALKHLDCCKTPVSDLTPLASLTALRYLGCINTNVSDLTPLASLTALQSLDCENTNVSDLTPLASLTALHVLQCSQTQVSDLTPLASLTTLQHLDCDNTNVSDLTPLASLTALRHLGCSNTQVSDLTPLASLTALIRLFCCGTKVHDLTPLATLTALWHVFSCSYTLVRDLTPLISLTALQRLDCSGCRLNGLPPAIRNNDGLTLHAFNTQVPGLPNGVLSQSNREDCRARVKAHYDDLASGAADLTEVKLLLLGNGGVGKTQIARWFAGAGFDPEWNSTHGITIVNQPQPDSIAAWLHLQMWDFGGQDIYHGTHVMFLRGAAVLMPVWATDRENRDTDTESGLTFRNHPLSYWIAVVKHQASPDSPMLITQSKCDQKDQERRRCPLPDEAMNALRYVTELHVSPKTNRGLGTLQDALNDAILWMRDPNRLGLPQIGAGRLRVQRRLEALRDADMALPPPQRRHRLLEREEFEAICAEEGGVSSPAHLLEYLDANGTVFYRQGMFFDRIVLDQNWALDAIYAVFDRQRVYKVVAAHEGRISRADLGRLVWQQHSDDEQKLLLSMMVSCGICFLHRRFNEADDDDAEYIVPDLLPERQTVAEGLVARWDEDRPGESAIFRCAMLHNALIRSIMAEIGTIAGVNALYWRGGLCVFDAGTRSRVLIEQEMTGDWQGEIRVRTQNGQAATLLEKAVEIVERAHARLGMRPDKVERSAPAVKTEATSAISPGPETTTTPEWYVSYAWGDDRTPEGRARQEIVDRLCDAAAAQGHRILRDTDTLSHGDSITAFMKKIGTGDRVFVILSDKYLRSPFCMFELSEVWRTSKQHKQVFLDRVRVYALPDVDISEPEHWGKWSVHWKHQYDALNAFAHKHDAVRLGEHGFRRLQQMEKFYIQVADILGALADIVQPRTFEELQRYGFGDPSTA